MPDITIPCLAMVSVITHHAIRRYTERRHSFPCFIIDDLCRARPLTKQQMKKNGIRRFRDVFPLRTTDGFIFIIYGGRVVTCYYENKKVSTYEKTGTSTERGGHAPRNPRRSKRAGRQSHSRPSLMAEFRRIPVQPG